jgi:release factor glutamine methyltransferase
MTTDLTIQQWIHYLSGLRTSSDTPRLDAELVIMKISACSRAWLIAHSDEYLPQSAMNKLIKLVEPFKSGMPMAYLTGQQEFWSLSLQVNHHTLIPRPATESLVEWILQALPLGPVSVLDLGTGSGAIALALKSERELWHITATDESDEALCVAKTNALNLGLDIEFLAGSWWKPVLGRRFDCVVSNPPYIAESDSHLKALKDEPKSALIAGIQGLDDLSTIAQGVYDQLNPGGWVVLEHGYNQQGSVMALLWNAGLIEVTGFSDLSGQDRFVVGQRG